MNIQVQLCGLCILVLLIIFLNSHRTLRLYKEKVFYLVLYTITIGLVLDMLSLIFIYFRQTIPIHLVNFVCKSYVITLVWGTCSALIYVITDLVSESRHRRITRMLLLLLCIQGTVVYALPIQIFSEGSRVYTYGASVLAVYLFVAVYMAATLSAVFLFRKRLNPRRGFAIALWMLIWMVAAGIQFLNNDLLIVGFASALGVLILFVLLENPEANLDRRLGCFNSYALTEYLNQLYAQHIGFSVLEIYFDSTMLSGRQDLDTDEILQKMIHLAKHSEGLWVFKRINLSLVIIAPDSQSLEAVGKEILSECADVDSTRDAVGCILVPCADELSDTDDLYRFLAFAGSSRRACAGTLLTTI